MRGLRILSRLKLFFFVVIAGNAFGDDALSAGKLLLTAGNYQKAVQLLSSIRESKQQCEATYYLGIARYRLHQLEQAVVDLQAASKCDPSNAGAQLALAQVYLDKQNEDLAGAALEASLKIKPDDPVALRTAASMYMKRELHGQAIGKLEALVRINPNDATAHADLGASYASQGDIDKGKEQFEEALRLRADSASAMVGLGNIYLKTGDPAKAADLLNRAVEKDPKACEPQYLLGTIASTEGRYQEALTHYRDSIRLGCKDGEIHYRMAYAYRNLGRSEESKKEMARFTEMRSQSNATVEATRESLRLLESAKQLVDQGKLTEAMSLMERAVTLDPANPRLHFRLGSLHFDMKNFLVARGEAQQAIFLAPSEWMYHYLLALIEESDGRPQSAVKSLEAVTRLNPAFADAFNRLGNLAVARQDYLEAIRQYRKAVQLSPDEKAYALNLAAAESRAKK